MNSTTSLRRILTVGIAALAIALGAAPAAAMADASYGQVAAMAGPGGAASHEIFSRANDDGSVSYFERHTYAGPDGAWSFTTSSSADGSGGPGAAACSTASC